MQKSVKVAYVQEVTSIDAYPTGSRPYYLEFSTIIRRYRLHRRAQLGRPLEGSLGENWSRRNE
jgi:hypothetical protein